MQQKDLRDDWPALFPSLQAQFPKLSDDALDRIDGDRERLEHEIAKRHDMTAAEAREAVADWMVGPMPSDAFAHPTHDNAAVRDSGKYIPDGEDALADDARFGDDDTVESPIRRRA